VVDPTPSQRRIRDYEQLDLLVVAPAGCGKTEALALRIAGLLERGDIKQPQRVLVTTFSNRARDNLRDRLNDYLSPQRIRAHVTVANFHSLSARIFRAHANVIGLDPKMTIPDSDWIGDQCRERNLGFKMTADVLARLRIAKQQAVDDETVEQILIDGGSPIALALERLRIADGRLTYDDLPRLAELILANDSVAEIYRNHFGAIAVDEFQDLTPQQLRIINRLGYKKTTFAGDVAQGIYGFTGAKPDEISRRIRAECSEVVELFESHRSSPAVLAMINTLIQRTGGAVITPADDASWPGGGLAGVLEFGTVDAEADWIVKFCQGVHDRAPGQRIGVIARATPRRRFVDQAVEASSLAHHRWEDGHLDTDTAGTMRSMLTKLSVTDFLAADDRMEYLRTAAGLEIIQDPDSRRFLVDALNWCHDLLLDGTEPASIRARIKVGDDSTLLNIAGVHLLTGHIGKGQQFDWVIVVGAEEGSIPDFRATDVGEEARILAVMISRARHGAVVTFAKNVPAKGGISYTKQPSTFLPDLRSANCVVDASGARRWLASVSWKAIANR
jgi:DNA helicase II / ATP-dependent DNA helicase PcrA